MIKAYHRPETIEAALQLLSHSNVRILTGFSLNDAHLDEVTEEVVDLQELGLEGIHPAEGGLQIGAMTRLQTLVDTPTVPELLREMAHAEDPNTFRNMRTIGSIIVNPISESRLLAALLTFEARVAVQSLDGRLDLSLPEFLAGLPLPGSLVTSVTIQTEGDTAHASAARTPADAPIVAAVARRAPNGQIYLALCGVAPTPVLVNPAQTQDLQPAGDFRGSSAYRQHMATVLSNRVLSQLG
jgi:putative selenate reductase FAD-binding subunit